MYAQYGRHLPQRARAEFQGKQRTSCQCCHRIISRLGFKCAAYHCIKGGQVDISLNPTIGQTSKPTFICANLLYPKLPVSPNIPCPIKVQVGIPTTFHPCESVTRIQVDRLNWSRFPPARSYHIDSNKQSSLWTFQQQQWHNLQP